MGDQSFGSEFLRWARMDTRRIVGMLVPLIIGSAFICIGGSSIAKDAMVRIAGEGTVGAVLGKRQKVSGSGGRSRTVYSVDYKFTVGPVPYHGTTQVSSSAYNSLKVGEKVDIVYLPRNPDVSRLKFGKAQVAILGPCIFLVAGGGAIVGSMLGVRSVARRARLSLGGEETVGTITRIIETQGGYRSIEYAFQDSRGQAYSGTIKNVLPQMAQTLESRRRLIVYYASGNPNRHCIDLTRIRGDESKEGTV